MFSENEEQINTSFTELEQQAENLFPGLLEQIKTFNSSHISIENYENYLRSLNYQPSSITTNHV